MRYRPFCGPSIRDFERIKVGHGYSYVSKRLPNVDVLLDLSAALEQAFDLVRRAKTKSSSNIVRNDVYVAEKDLFGRMQDVGMNDSLEDVLIGYAQSLRSSANQVEESRLKAAEAGAALCSLAGKGGRLGAVLMQQLSQLQAQERSVLVQQCLERAARSLAV